jgi:L-arabinose isomerase
MDEHPLRVGLFGIGLEAYWPQFEGLKPRLEGYLGQVAQKLGRPRVEVCNLGLIDSPEKRWRQAMPSAGPMWTSSSSTSRLMR